MARKFIVTIDRFVMGNVDYHKDLVSRGSGDASKPVLGGGRWETDNDNNILYLWGSSVDYGWASPEQVKRAIESEETYISHSMEGWQIKYSGIISNDMPEISSFIDLMLVPVH